MSNLNGTKDSEFSGLENILEAIEPRTELRSLVVETCKTASYLNEDNTVHHGLTFYMNHNPLSKLKVNGANAQFIQEKHSIYTPEGKQFIKAIFKDEEKNDGAVELLMEGLVGSIRRMFKGDPDESAAEIGKVQPDHEASYKEWGFVEQVFSRHIYAIHASAKDPQAYLVTRSEKGRIRVMHAGNIIYSSLPEEIHPIYSQYLGQGKASPKSQSTKNPEDYHRVHEARGSPTISAEEALRLQLAILHEHKIANHHYI